MVEIGHSVAASYTGFILASLGAELIKVEHQRDLLPTIEDFAATFDSRALSALLDQHGVPNAPVQTIEQVVVDPQTVALGMVQQGPENAFPTVGLPLTFDGERPPYRAAAPRLGQHTQDWLGANSRQPD